MISYGLLLLVCCAFASAMRPPLDGRIVGGEPADIEDFPHQVAFLYGGRQICGGSIIGQKWVLTAAHCTRNLKVEYISFRAGSTMRNQGGSIHNAEKIFDNPDYNPSNYDYDFSLIRVVEPFQYGIGVQAIKLASVEPIEGTVITVTGWGALSSGGSSPDDLRQVDVLALPRTSCDTAYGGRITKRMICAKDIGRDACQGDSGGPLIDTADNTLVGVVSWGFGCADPKYPGVYSNVADQKSWIYDVTNIKF